MASIGVGVQSTQYIPRKSKIRPRSANISVKEMYHYSKLINNDFANSFYKTPYREFDHIKSIENKKYWKYNTNPKIKRQKEDRLTKESRERDFELIKKHSKGVPAPWNYELWPKWMKGPNAREVQEKLTREKKKMLKKWKGKNAGLVDERDRFYREDAGKGEKIDLNAKKNTYIDQLIRDNTRRKFPRPGPGAHFLSVKSIKRMPEEKRDLFMSRKIKDMIKANSSALASRDFHLVENPKDLKLFPGPGKYDPNELAEKNFMKKKNYMQRKEYKKKCNEDHMRRRGMKSRLKEHVENKRQTMITPIPEKPVPIHQNFVTFTAIGKKWKGKGKNKRIRRPVKPSDKEPFFGKARRFPRTENEVWVSRLKTFNSGTQGEGKNDKTNPVPGPGHYKTTEVWKGKKKGKRMKRPVSANPKIGDRILKSISKGPKLSIYHSRRSGY